MGKERITGGKFPEPESDQIVTAAAIPETQQLMQKDLVFLMGTTPPLLKNTIEAIRSLSPYFHPDNNHQWSRVDLQALAVYLAYYHGQRKQSLLSLLPQDFPPQMFHEIDENFLSHPQIAEQWKINRKYVTKLIQLIFPRELIVKKMPYRCRKNHHGGIFLVLPDRFHSLIGNEIKKARENNITLSKWIREHRETILSKAEKYLPDFPEEYQRWLEENITEASEKLKPWWQPNPRNVEMSISKTAAVISDIRTRSANIDISTEPNTDELHRIHLTPLSYVRLTPEEEKALGGIISSMFQAEEAQPSSQNQSLYDELIKTGKTAREIMIETNLRLIFSPAQKNLAIGKKRGLSFEDLFQYGTIGLMRAAEKFDHQRGIKFSTYATFWIKQAIKRGIRNYSPIRIPVYKQERTIKEVKKLTEQQQTLTINGQTKSAREIEAKIASLLKSLNLVIKSLNDPFSGRQGNPDDNSSALGEHFSPPRPSIEENAFLEIRKNRIVEAFERAQLTDREKQILEKIFFDGQTLIEVGQPLNLTRERIRQIRNDALKKLKKVIEEDPFFQPL